MGRNNIVWETSLFHKIPDPRPSYEKGNRLEVATEIALIKSGLKYKDLTNEYQMGHTPDFETDYTIIECKNLIGAYEGRYRVDQHKYETQIRPRYRPSSRLDCPKMKILVIPQGVVWDQSALRLAENEGIQFIFSSHIESNADIIPASNVILRQLLKYLGNLRRYIRSYYSYDISQYSLKMINSLLEGFEIPYEIKFSDQIEKNHIEWEFSMLNSSFTDQE